MLRRQRAAAQLLQRPEPLEPQALVRRLLAVQAQDLRAARLALRARSAGLTAADVDAALTDERSLVVAWLGRGTLHLVAAEDHAWLLALTAPTRFSASDRRLRQLGVSPEHIERAVTLIERTLTDEGPRTRPQLGERLAAAGIPVEGQALPHLLGRAGLLGVTVLGPLQDGVQAFALTRDWLGEPPPVERERALAELARRYLAAHGPATDADLARWIGLPLRDVRAGLRAIAADVEEGDDGLLDLAGRPAAPDRIPARLLPAFDPYVLGWQDRTFAVPPKHALTVHPRGGIVRAVASVDGRAVGTWRAPASGVEIEPFEPLDAETDEALAAEAADVRRFTG